MHFRRLVGFTVLAVLATPLVRGAQGAWTVYVSNERSGDVTVIDGGSRAVKATWPVGKRPRGIHVSPDGRWLYVAVSGSPIVAPGAHRERAESDAADKSADGIAVVDTATGKVVRKVEVGSDPEQFAVRPDGHTVVVSNEDESSASCWDLETGKRLFSTRVSEEPEGVALTPDGREVYVTCEQRGDIFVLDAADGHQLGVAHVRGRPRSVAFARQGTRVFVPAEGESTVSMLDRSNFQLLKAIRIAGTDVMPMCAVTSPDDRFVYVSTGRGNSVAILDAEAGTVVSTVSVGKRPRGIALSPDGGILFAANGRSDDVSVVDLAQRRELTRIKAGSGPWGIAVARR
jgi:YVTN family beta-propeller protein